MLSIREFNTTGMSNEKREKLFKEVEPIPVGEKVWEAGDAWEWERQIEVTPENQKIVTMFWNSLYFDNQKDAEMRTSIAHAQYGEYQDMAVRGIGG